MGEQCSPPLLFLLLFLPVNLSLVKPESCYQQIWYGHFKSLNKLHIGFVPRASAQKTQFDRFMSGIDREIILDPRHIPKHLPNTPQVQRLLRRGRSAHVFNHEATLEHVAQAIIERGEFTGIIRGYERYGLFFAEPIGDRISPDDGSRTPLFYGEVKIDAENRYHVIPRTGPSQA